MTVKDITIKKIVSFKFDNSGFAVMYLDETDTKKQYGSESRMEMSQFAEILMTELRPPEGTVEN